MKSGLSNTTPISQESITQTTSIPVEKVVAAVELLVDIGLSLTTTSSYTKNEFDAAKVDAITFLKEQNIQVDLLEGNYEAALKKLAPSFLDNTELNAIFHKAIIIALLARIRKQSKFADRIERNPEQTKLDQLVKSFLQKNGTSPNDALSILRADGQ